MWLFKNLGSTGSLKVLNRSTQPNARKLEVPEKRARGLRRKKIPPSKFPHEQNRAVLSSS